MKWKDTVLRSSPLLVGTIQTFQFIFLFLRQCLIIDSVLIPPAWVKRKTLLRVLQDNNLDVFIESGTYLGLTANAFAKKGVEVHTIEIDTALHNNVKNRFHGKENVTLYLGDAAILLRPILEQLENRKSLIFLDAHYSKGLTSTNGKSLSSLDSELSAASEYLKKSPQSVIVVDDIHELGEQDYPDLPHLISKFPQCRFRFSWNLLTISRSE